jgi:uncharacterized protein YdeI (YjbR/CyaY-like superfamily)
MISKSDDYFAKGCGRCERFATPDCSTRQWKRGLGELRRICLEAELVETVKWGHPCYLHGGRNIAILGAFRDDFRISFFNAAVMKDPEEVLEKQGPNTQHANMIRFADNDRVLDLEPVIRSYLMEAAAYADAGIRAPKENVDLDMPDELVETLDADVELAEAFRKLTPGRKRSYVIDLNSAKKPETRLARIAKFRDKILAGKGALER